MKNRGLGRGLSSLLREEIVPISNGSFIDIDSIIANNDQPRKIFDQERIQELADSIQAHGLIQPIVVTRQSDDKYKIVAGERRFRACKKVGLKKIPVTIKTLSDKEILEIALIENIQRQELTAIEEAEGFQKLIEEFGYSQIELGQVVGKSRSHVANLLRMNQLQESIKLMVNDGRLTMGHARCLIGLDNAQELALTIVEKDLNVRQTEELVNSSKKRSATPSGSKSAGNKKIIDEDLRMLSQSLSEKFGIKVVVENSLNGGTISLHYSNLEDLDTILTRLN